MPAARGDPGTSMPTAVLLISLAILLSALVASAAWFRAGLPPTCADPRTVALVRQSLITHNHLPAAITLDNIRTVAGGWLALRFVCTAELASFDPHALPEGTPIPGQIHFT